MKYHFIFLCLIILSLEHLETKLNVMMRPLVEALKLLCEGVEAYNYYKKQTFNLRDTYLWLIYDFMAYGIFAMEFSRSYGKDSDC
jgi:hypothetical protein